MAPLSLVLLLLAAFVASTFTAVISAGGGLVLLAILPLFVPPGAIVPVHGVVQLASNVSRALFGLRHAEWSVFWPFLGGAVVGAALGAPVIRVLPPAVVPPVLGVFILLVTWAPGVKTLGSLPGKYVTLGAAVTAAALVVGGIGIFVSPVLMRSGFERDRLVVTHAVLVAAVHTLKILVFGMLGFAFRAYLPMIVGMILAATAGSYVGTHLRARVSEEAFRIVFKVTISVLALRMLVRALF